jgi:hypothetical protein
MSSVSSAERLRSAVAVIRSGGTVESQALGKIGEFLRPPVTQRDALLECLELIEKRLIGAPELAPCLPVLLFAWNRLHSALLVIHERAAKEWANQIEYPEICNSLAVLLDLFGYLQDPSVQAALRAAIDLPEVQLKMFALTSLLRQGESVGSSQIESVAASNETRILLWRRLREIGKEDLMPPTWATAQQLATSDMVWWASHPNELGTPPEDVELMATCGVDLEGEQLEVFVFRFREYPKPWAPSEGWMAGIAGPFREGESLGSPWSAFDTWDSMSPEAHFKKLIASACWCEVDNEGS